MQQAAPGTDVHGDPAGHVRVDADAQALGDPARLDKPRRLGLQE